jgi:hypothetical protein
VKPSRAEPSSKLPPHVKTVGRINWEKMDDFVLRAGRPQTTRDAYAHAKLHTLSAAILAATPSTGPKRVDLAPGDFQVFADAGYLVPLRAPPRIFVELFTTPEKMNDAGEFTRRRLVNWPVDINAHTAEPWPIKLADRTAIVEGCAFEGAILYDIDAMFIHFPLPEDALPYHAVLHEGALWAISSIPTGGRHCPALAHSVSEAVADEVLTRFRARCGDEPAPKIDVYIDNFRIAGARRNCELAAELFEEVCVEIGLRFSGGGFAGDYVFLGVQCAHRREGRPASIRAAEKSLMKLRLSAAEALDSEGATVLHAMRLLGSLMWVSSAANVELHRFYLPLKFFRRRACARDLDEPLAMWPSALPGLRLWIRTALRNEPRYLREAAPDEEDAFLFSDACLDGFGGVLVLGSSVRVFSGSWAALLQPGPPPHINQLEAAALLANLCLSLAALPPDAPRRLRANIFVDNTTLFFAVGRGYSPTFWVNEAVAETRSLLSRFASWRVAWLASAQNLADGPSRAIGPDSPGIWQVLADEPVPAHKADCRGAGGDDPARKGFDTLLRDIPSNAPARFGEPAPRKGLDTQAAGEPGEAEPPAANGANAVHLGKARAVTPSASARLAH